jgi:hypothetical protein
MVEKGSNVKEVKGKGKRGTGKRGKGERGKGERGRGERGRGERRKGRQKERRKGETTLRGIQLQYSLSQPGQTVIFPSTVSSKSMQECLSAHADEFPCKHS